MSIADELNHYAGGLEDAYDAVNDMNGVIPANRNMDNLDTAIRTIPQPTVNDGTLTVTVDGTTAGTFTANQASNTTIALTSGAVTPVAALPDTPVAGRVYALSEPSSYHRRVFGSEVTTANVDTTEGIELRLAGKTTWSGEPAPETPATFTSTTGTVTYTINGVDYQLRLGNIVLNSLSDDIYDYIYQRADGDWYIHKRVGIFDTVEDWADAPGGSSAYYATVSQSATIDGESYVAFYLNGQTYNGYTVWGNTMYPGYFSANFYDTIKCTRFKTFLMDNNTGENIANAGYVDRKNLAGCIYSLWGMPSYLGFNSYASTVAYGILKSRSDILFCLKIANDATTIKEWVVDHPFKVLYPKIFLDAHTNETKITDTDLLSDIAAIKAALTTSSAVVKSADSQIFIRYKETQKQSLFMWDQTNSQWIYSNANLEPYYVRSESAYSYNSFSWGNYTFEDVEEAHKEGRPVYFRMTQYGSCFCCYPSDNALVRTSRYWSGQPQYVTKKFTPGRMDFVDAYTTGAILALYNIGGMSGSNSLDSMFDQAVQEYLVYLSRNTVFIPNPTYGNDTINITNLFKVATGGSGAPIANMNVLVRAEDGTGYKYALPGVAFDIASPIYAYTYKTTLSSGYYSTTYLSRRSQGSYYAVLSSSSDISTYSHDLVQGCTIYLVATKNGTSYTIDTKPYSGTLPTTEDGKIYMPIGAVVSTGTTFVNAAFDPRDVWYEYKTGLGIVPYIASTGGGTSDTSVYYYDTSAQRLYEEETHQTMVYFSDVYNEVMDGKNVIISTKGNANPNVIASTYRISGRTETANELLVYGMYDDSLNGPTPQPYCLARMIGSGNGYVGFLNGYWLQKEIRAGTNVQIASDGYTISATDTTYSDFTGATSLDAGAHGLVPAPTTSDPGKFLKGDGTWGEASEKFVIMKYGEASAWAKFIDAYNNNKIVYCRASSNANPGTGAQTRLAFMAYVNDEASPTNVEFQYVRSVGTKTSSQPVDQVFVYKLESTNGGTWTVQTRDMAPKLAAGTNASVSYSSGTYTVSATDTTYSAFTGATSGTAGTSGLVPAPAAGDEAKVLAGDGTWVNQPTVNDATLTVQHNSTTIDTFSANASSNKTINVETIYADTVAPISTIGTITTNNIADAAVTSAKIDWSTVADVNYSLTEQSTGGTWVDGKTIYKKTIDFGTLPNAAQKNVAHGISNLDTIVDMSFVAKNPTSSTWTYIPAASVNATANQIAYVVSSTNVTCVSGVNYSAYTVSYVTLWYTKSS